jgi:hypothetical protein
MSHGHSTLESRMRNDAYKANNPEQNHEVRTFDKDPITCHNYTAMGCRFSLAARPSGPDRRPGMSRIMRFPPAGSARTQSLSPSPSLQSNCDDCSVRRRSLLSTVHVRLCRPASMKARLVAAAAAAQRLATRAPMMTYMYTHKYS